ncbi:MAG: hypothetical protein CL581_02870 [Alteromonadaceae bacterium]|nr:hypothetical protein [Alteromonadaceae bacterium]MBH84396.1 hypothetical protein [Alteromonadaceae bacterium]
MTDLDTSTETPDFQFTQHCAGRYQLELPTDMKQILASYSEPDIGVTTYPNSDVEHLDGVLRGDNRVEQWLKHVEGKREEDMGKTGYIHKSLDGELKTVVYYSDDRELMNDPETEHGFYSFFLKDYPDKDIAIAISGGASKGVISRDKEDYKAIFRDRLAKMQERANHVRYLPWPHIQPGVCLDSEFTVHSEIAPESEDYAVKFYNGKGSNLKVSSHHYSSESGLDQELSRNSGLLSFFASTSMKVVGREGKLFTSSGKYSDKVREFRWVSTDTKLNSIERAHLEISGKIDMEDYPEMAPMNGTDVIVGLLKGVQVRENGMLGVKR